jgi:WhiB family transcriptional regulator, redox-sensing transcriptional regulator
MAKDTGGDLDWMVGSECAKPENKKIIEIFFSPKYDERHAAKNICFACPVRKDCLKWALESKQIWGIWGGRDEDEIRRTLSVNVDGAEVRRSRFPICPYCSANTKYLKASIVDKPGGGRWTTMRIVECLECSFKWRSRTSANAVNAFHALAEEKAAKKAKGSKS